MQTQCLSIIISIIVLSCPYDIHREYINRNVNYSTSTGYINYLNQPQVIGEIKFLKGALSIENKYYSAIGILFFITTKDNKSKIVFTADKQKLTEVSKIINQIVHSKQLTNKSVKIPDQTGEATFLFQVHNYNTINLTIKAHIQNIKLTFNRQNLLQFEQLVKLALTKN